jgi:hypothetical protein
MCFAAGSGVTRARDPVFGGAAQFCRGVIHCPEKVRSQVVDSDLADTGNIGDDRTALVCSALWSIFINYMHFDTCHTICDV